MILIGLFFPAFITLAIRQRRNAGRGKGWLCILLEYGQAVLFCNLIVMITITYILKIDNVEISAFNSFPFFTKYVVIAVAYSALIPYLEEMVRKVFGVKFTIMGKDEKE